MKSTVVPAQITTVEDKIAGSLSFPQIMLLVFSLIIGTALYGLISPKLHLTTVKAIVISFQFLIFGLLALRYQGRILADWLVLYLRYRARPKIYIYTKNDVSSRPQMQSAEITQNIVSKPLVKTYKKKTEDKKTIVPIIENTGLIVSIKPSKKGGLDVEYLEA